MRRRGIWRVESALIAEMLLLLAGVVVPIMRDVKRGSTASHILTLISLLRESADRHHRDTGRYAEETSTASDEDAHQLSQPQDYSGWCGPYLDQPFSTETNPCGGASSLVPTLSDTGGFDPTGRGDVQLAGPGQCLTLSGVPLEIAHEIDQAIDRNVPGDWTDTGRVKYDEAKQTLSALILYER